MKPKKTRVDRRPQPSNGSVKTNAELYEHNRKVADSIAGSSIREKMLSGKIVQVRVK